MNCIDNLYRRSVINFYLQLHIINGKSLSTIITTRNDIVPFHLTDFARR